MSSIMTGLSPMPAPRPTRGTGDLSRTTTSQSRARSAKAAMTPPSDPPTTRMRALPTQSRALAGRRAAEVQLQGHPVRVLDEHLPQVHGRDLAQRDRQVRRLQPRNQLVVARALQGHVVDGAP